MAGKLGMGLLETLLENLDRDLDLSNTTLTNPIITTTAVVSASGGVKLAGLMTSNYLDFLSGFQGNLTSDAGHTFRDVDLDAAAAATDNAVLTARTTLSASAVNATDYIGNAVGAVYLPAATADTHLVLEIEGDVDEAGPLLIFTTGGTGGNGVFAKQVIGPEKGGETAQSVETPGTNLLPTGIQLVYTAAGANTNFLGVGSMVHFYCPVDGQWLVKIRNVAEGTGDTGVLTCRTV